MDASRSQSVEAKRENPAFDPSLQGDEYATSYLRHMETISSEAVTAAPPVDEVIRNPSRSLVIDAYAAISGIALMLIMSLQSVGSHLGVDRMAGITAFAIYAVLSAIALFNVHSHPHRRFGVANVITTVRAAITSLVGGLVLTPSNFKENMAFETLTLVGVMVALALLLDGADGYFARRARAESRYGARFDMEVDALLILFLSIAAFELGKAGIWVIAIGAMRYVYGLAQIIVPILNGDLPPSMRRKIICVVQGAVLCIILFPVISPPVSILLASGALLLLSYSFYVDLRYLLTANRRA